MAIRSGAPTLMAGRMLGAVSVTVISFAAACGNDTLVPDVEHPAVIISNPVAIQTPSVAAGADGLGQRLVYISLPPGSIDGVAGLEIENRASGMRLSVPLVDGGFDPVATSAQTGDVLQFTLLDATRETWTETIEDARPPVIVRTDPPSGKRDVPISLIIEIVFSEPMNPATLTTATLQLLLHGEAVAGTVELASNGLGARFIPDTSLSPGATYVLRIGSIAGDLDDQQLGSTIEVQFTTAEAFEEPPSDLTIAIVSGNEQSDTIGASLAEPLVVRVQDGSGAPMGGVEVLWEAPWVVNEPGVYPTFVTTGSHRAVTTTAPDGLASVELRLGSRTGSWRISASIPGVDGNRPAIVQLWAASVSGSPTQLEWQSYPYLMYAPDPRAPSWMRYPTYDVTITGLSFSTALSAAAVDAGGNPVGVPIEWSVRSGDVLLTPLYVNGVLNTAAVMATPQADGPIVVEAASPGFSAMMDTIYAAATIILTVGSGDGHCEEGSFVPNAVHVTAGRSVAWSVCEQDGDGWQDQDGVWSWSYEHNVTFEDGVVVWPSTTEDWRPRLRAFDTPGTYRYRCTLHSTGFDDERGETGVVIVE